MAKTPRFIEYTELSQGLKDLIEAGAKIFPINTVEDLPLVKDKDYYRILSGEEKNNIYTWDVETSMYILVGADDKDVLWTEIKNKPTEFTPQSHTHVTSQITNFPTTMQPSPHNHTELEIINLNKYTTQQVDAFLTNKVDKITGKGLSTNDFTTDEKTKLSQLYTDASFDYATMVQQLSDHKISTDHDNRYYQKTEINNLLANKSDVTTVNGHTSNTTIHVTQTNKDTWDAKASTTYVTDRMPIVVTVDPASPIAGQTIYMEVQILWQIRIYKLV